MNTKDRSQILIPLSKAKSTSSLHSTTSSVATSLTSSETSFDPNADPESEPESDQRRRPRILGLRELSALSLQSGLHPPRPGSKDSQGPSAPHRTGHAGPAHGRAVGLEDTERAAKSIPRPGELKRTPSPPPRIRLMKAVTPVVMGDGGDGGGGRGGGGPFAREVEIKGWKIVGGRSWTDKAKVGAYVVYDVEISLRDAGSINILRRYTDFVKLRSALKARYPHLRQAIPQLPGKAHMSKFSPKFLADRQPRLQRFLRGVMLHPEMGVGGEDSVIGRWVVGDQHTGF